MIQAIFGIAKKEVLDNIRNKWVIILTIIFTILTILASYAGSVFGDGWQDLSGTMASMSSLVQYLISIIALILGYSAIIGEIEKGSMSSLLSLPVTRDQILLGKFLGLGAILSFSIFIGFGIAGVIIGLNVDNVNYGEYLFFILSSILMGLIFLSIGLFISTALKKRSTAMGSAIFVWVLFAIIWIFIAGAIIIASGALQIDPESPEDFDIPDAYYASTFFNPLDCYGSFISLNIDSLQSISLEDYGFSSPPGYYNSTNMLISMLIWLFTPLLLAFYLFRKKDI